MATRNTYGGLGTKSKQRQKVDSDRARLVNNQDKGAASGKKFTKYKTKK